MTKLDNDLRALEKYMNNKYINNSITNKSNTSFESEGLIYPFTNEELKTLFNLDLTNKASLVVTSSADHILHAVLNGSIDITSFDINIFSKYYANLKIAMIKTYNYFEFANKITSFINACNKNRFNLKLIYKVLNDVSNNLSNDDVIFWNEFFNQYNKSIYRENVFKLGNTLSFCSYYDKNKYYGLKEKLNNIKINYVDSDIISLEEKTNKKFDYVHISNIPDYIKNPEIFSSVFIMLHKMLKTNGNIDASIVGIFSNSNYNKKRIETISQLYEINPIETKITGDVRFTKK